MSSKWVISSCQQLLSSFDKRRHTSDTHFQEAAGRLRCQDDTALQLLKTIYEGCFRYEKGVKVLLGNFYADKAGSVLRADYQLFRIFAYVAVFGLEDVGFATFNELVLSQDATKMCHIVSYVFDEHNLHNHLKADWMQVYDLMFIEESLIATVHSYSHDARQLCRVLEKQSVGETPASQAAKSANSATSPHRDVKPTRPQSPNITKPRPPRVPEPFAIHQTTVRHPVPESTYTTSLADIGKQQQQRYQEVREQTLQKYDGAPNFKLHETRNTTELLQREAEEKIADELQFSMSFHKPPPDFSSKPANVRLNTAAILREEALLRQQQAKEAEIIRAYETQLRDAREYYVWQQEMTKLDEIGRLEQVEMRRELAKTSAHEAKMARAYRFQENAEIANKIREESSEVSELRAALEEQELEQKRELRKTVSAHREDAPYRAKEGVAKEKEEAARLVREQLAQQQEEKRKQAEQEAEERAGMIRKLKASLIHQPHVRVLDPTETANLGLLEEMSLLEMKERLARQKTVEKEMMERKRAEIVASKQKKSEELQKRVDNITRARQERSRATQALWKRNQEVEAERERTTAELREASAKKLLSQIEAKHTAVQQEKHTLKLEQERAQKQQIYLGAAKNALEERQFDDLLRAAEREAKESSRAQVTDTRRQASIAKKEKANVRVAKAAEAKTAADLNTKRKKETATRESETKTFTRRELANRKQKFQTIRDSEKSALESFRQINPYATMITKRSVEAAKTLQSV